jgi:hypothetical protein
MKIRDILFLPFGFLAQISPLVFLILILACVLIGGFFYYTVNSDFFGLAAPPFGDFHFIDNYETLTDHTKRSWKISYESFSDTTFSGLVRHVSHWREDAIPFATHDVLVTTGDFADSKISVSVNDHKFTYTYPDRNNPPKGTINLLHIVPFNESIYRQLLQVRNGQTVSISGQEIYKIDMFNPEGKSIGYWQDHGCNSILVKSVVIK